MQCIVRSTKFMPKVVNNINVLMFVSRKDILLIRHGWTLAKDTVDYCLSPCFYAPNCWPKLLTKYWTVSFQK